MFDEYYVDVQFMQTGAFGRGMGRYFQGFLLAFLEQLDQESPKGRVHCMYTSELSSENITALQKVVEGKGLAIEVVFAKLQLRVNDLHRYVYDEVYEHNRTVFNAYLSEQSPSNSERRTLWLLPCLMQEPTVSVFPDDPAVVKTVIWYDLIPYLLYNHHFPDPKSPHARSYLKRVNILLNAERIFTISLASKVDIVEHLSLPARRLVGMDGSVNEDLMNAKPEDVSKIVKAPFFLCPASPEPSKNILNTIKGFGEFNAAHDNKYQLIVTSNYDEKLARDVDQYAKNVTFTGHINSGKLRRLYEQSQALLFVSIHEGLGMPILEAAGFGKRVVCSDIPVFREISPGDAFYWCDPADPASIAASLKQAIKGGTTTLSDTQKQHYAVIMQRYTWENAAKTFVAHVKDVHAAAMPTKKVAIVGPHPASFSTIGKVIGETIPYLLEVADTDWYFDSGPSDERHGLVHFHYLQEYDHLYPIGDLAENIGNYDRIIYHMGSSDHHMKTYLLAKLHPDTVVLHDTNLGGKGLSGQMLSNGFMSPARVKLETNIETGFLGQPERFLTSLVSTQKRMITHSKFAAKIVDDYHMGGKNTTTPTRLPIHTLEQFTAPDPKSPIRLGLTGILSEVKGTDMLDWLFEETNGLAGCELYVFGFGFFVDKSRLLAMESKHPNLKVEFDLSNAEFKGLLTKLDMMINYRIEYHGETSRTSLEAMRERVVPIVRNIGWFAELPDDTCYKLDAIEELPALIRDIGQNPAKARKELATKVANGQALLEDAFNFEDYVEVLLKD